MENLHKPNAAPPGDIRRQNGRSVDHLVRTLHDFTLLKTDNVKKWRWKSAVQL